MMAYKEYIGCKSIECVDYDGKGNDLYAMWLTDTEIIRCRDCKCRVGENAQGKNPNLCTKLYMITKPDGFCAWAERDV